MLILPKSLEIDDQENSNTPGCTKPFSLWVSGERKLSEDHHCQEEQQWCEYQKYRSFARLRNFSKRKNVEFKDQINCAQDRQETQANPSSSID
jgi:hypothetical protein